MNVPNEARTGHREGRWLPVALLVLTLGLYLPTINQGNVLTDSQASAASAWRIASTGAPWMEGVPVDELAGPFPDMWLVETAHGHVVHNRTPGSILPAVPFYWLLDNDAEPAGFEIWVGGLAAALLTSLSGLLLFFALRPRIGDRGAFGASAVLLLTTPLWSVNADALWTHNLTVLAIAGAMWAATRERWWVVGALFGLGIVARAHLAVVAAVVGVYLAWRQRDWRIMARVGVGSLAGLLLLVVWNRLVFGAWSVRGGYNPYVVENLLGGDRTLVYEFANHLGFLAAPDRGMLAWTPVILVLLPTMLAHWRELPEWVRAFAWAGVVYTLVQLQINSFRGGLGFYGYRLGLELLVCLAPALVLAYGRTAWRTRYVVGALLGLQFAAIAIGAAADSYATDDEGLWRTSSFALALADRPLAYGAFTALCIAGALVLTHALLRRTATAVPATVGSGG